MAGFMALCLQHPWKARLEDMPGIGVVSFHIPFGAWNRNLCNIYMTKIVNVHIS
jgi:hypothetical protein